MIFLSTIQNTPNIEEKIANAPDSNYEIGVLIGSLIPVTILIILAYLLYSYMKKQKKTGDDNISFD